MLIFTKERNQELNMKLCDFFFFFFLVMLNTCRIYFFSVSQSIAKEG